MAPQDPKVHWHNGVAIWNLAATRFRLWERKGRVIATSPPMLRGYTLLKNGPGFASICPPMYGDGLVTLELQQIPLLRLARTSPKELKPAEARQ